MNLNAIKITSIAAVASIGSFGLVQSAYGLTITQSASFPGVGDTTSTNFFDQPVVPDLLQFDPSLGTLNFVTFVLDGTVAGSAALESLDASPATITTNQQAEITFSVTGVGDVVQVIPLSIQMFDATEFDGTIDFGGTSGITFNDLTANDTNTTTLTTGLAPFIGTGTIDGLLTGLGQSNASGAGNLITQFQTEAGGTITVTYDFTPNEPPPMDVPEPTTLLGLLAMGGAGLVSRRRKS